MKKFLLALLMIVCFAFGASARDRYEYKVVPLGSLGELQKGKTAEAKTEQIEEILNKYGRNGWEIAEIFAVRTTFDPNVFFVILVRDIDD